MTEFVRFNSLYEHKDAETGKRTRFPSGWTGEVEADVAKGARKLQAVAPKDGGEKPSPHVTAARKAVAAAEAALSKASSDVEKAKAQDELTAAQAALTSLTATAA
jgi:hypothetical protein